MNHEDYCELARIHYDADTSALGEGERILGDEPIAFMTGDLRPDWVPTDLRPTVAMEYRRLRDKYEGRPRPDKGPREIDLGDVMVTLDLPGDINPYHYSLIGDGRAYALQKLATSGPYGYRYWHAPSSGGARELDPKGPPHLATTLHGTTVVLGAYKC